MTSERSPADIFWVGIAVQVLAALLVGFGVADASVPAVVAGGTIAFAGFWISVVGAVAWGLTIATRYLSDEEADGAAAVETVPSDVPTYLAANPGSRPSEIGRALDREPWEVTRELEEGSRRGLYVVRAGGRWYVAEGETGARDG